MTAVLNDFELIGIAKKAKTGSPTAKAILMHLVSRASSQGGDIFESKQRMADHLEMTKRCVQKHLNDFVASGLLKVSNRRPCKRGYTVQYEVDVAVLRSLPKVGERRVNDVHGCMTFTGRGERGSRVGVNEVHPDLPSDLPIDLPTKEGDSEKQDDLDFSATDAWDVGQPSPAKKKKPYEEEFSEFWSAFPKGTPNRKTGRAQSFKLFTAIASGKHKEIGQTDASVMISGAKAYAAVREQMKKTEPGSEKYIKGLEPWLRAEAWEAALDDAKQQGIDPDKAAESEEDGMERLARVFREKMDSKDSKRDPYLDQFHARTLYKVAVYEQWPQEEIAKLRGGDIDQFPWTPGYCPPGAKNPVLTK